MEALSLIQMQSVEHHYEIYGLAEIPHQISRNPGRTWVHNNPVPLDSNTAEFWPFITKQRTQNVEGHWLLLEALS